MCRYNAGNKSACFFFKDQKSDCSQVHACHIITKKKDAMESTTCKYETANLSRFSKESHKQTSASFIPFSLFSLYAMTDSEEEQHNRSRTSNRIAPHCSWTNLLIVLSPRPSWMSGASSAASPTATGRAIAVSPCRGTSTGLASE